MLRVSASGTDRSDSSGKNSSNRVIFDSGDVGDS